MKEMIKRVREEKGGFTLAELLIVVAIILVLVAIAIPVFSGALGQAEKAAANGQISAVKSTASAAIVLEPKAYGITGATDDTKVWEATADVSGSGTVSNLQIQKAAADAAITDEATKGTDGSYKVTVKITNTELPKAPTT